MEKEKIVVIGAGPAGLTFAYYMLSFTDKYEIIILEKSECVGGISKTVEFDNYKVDTGIHRFFSKSDIINDIWTDIMPIQCKPSYDDIILNKERKYNTEGSNPEMDDNSLLYRDRVTRILYGQKFYDYPISLNYNLIKNLGFFNIVRAAFSYLKSCLFKRKEETLEDFFINRFGKVLYEMFFENYTEKVWGKHPKNISADWGVQRVKGISIFEIIKDFLNKKLNKKNADNTETSLIENFLYPKYGAGQMWEEMAKRIINMGGKIVYNCEVTRYICQRFSY